MTLTRRIIPIVPVGVKKNISNRYNAMIEKETQKISTDKSYTASFQLLGNFMPPSLFEFLYFILKLVSNMYKIDINPGKIIDILITGQKYKFDGTAIPAIEAANIPTDITSLSSSDLSFMTLFHRVEFSSRFYSSLIGLNYSIDELPSFVYTIY